MGRGADPVDTSSLRPAGKQLRKALARDNSQAPEDPAKPAWPPAPGQVPRGALRPAGLGSMLLLAGIAALVAAVVFAAVWSDMVRGW